MEETYKKGDILQITEFYISKYPNWKVEGKKAKVVEAKLVRNISKSELDHDKDTRSVFQAQYGIQKEYPLWYLLVEVEKVKYVVCQLGFRKQ